MRVLIEDTPFPPRTPEEQFHAGQWPCKWVGCEGCDRPSFVAAYKLSFSLDDAATPRIHVTADQRYELFLDGERQGRGPERGDGLNWFYETYDLELSPGPHVLVARVWSMDQRTHQAPAAQVSVRSGFLLAADAPHTDLLGTGIAPWEAKELDGYEFLLPPFRGAGELAGGTVRVDGARLPWGFKKGSGDGWRPVIDLDTARDQLNSSSWGDVDPHRLRPAVLPPMLDVPRSTAVVRHVDEPDGTQTTAFRVEAKRCLGDEMDSWQEIASGQGDCVVAAKSRRRVVLDLGDYYCGYPELAVSRGRGTRVRVHWAEALFSGPDPNSAKGNRDEVEGKYFIGRGDEFLPDGGEARVFDSLWWSCGRYVELLVETGDEPVTMHAFRIRETRYPLEWEGSLDLGDDRFNRALPILWRGLQMCSHETYMDCPYYEQLMYAGDTRLEVLTTYVATRDDRLPRKAVEMFARSLLPTGLTQSRYPCACRQVIPQFALFWVAMVHDYALWRGDLDFVRSLMVPVRTVCDAFLASVGSDGLLRTPEGWNWIDWVPEWSATRGAHPLDETGLSGVNNWQLVMVLTLAEKLERWVGLEERADRLCGEAKALADRATEAFWREDQGLIADTPTGSSLSEHAQCYALLSGLLEEGKRERVLSGLLSDLDLARATIYFQHYLFEALTQAGRADAILDRLDLWYGLPGMGFKTTLEAPEPSRSDCHAWGAHPIYHAFASILGIRPAAPGFERVTITPQLGGLPRAAGVLMHPRGEIQVRFQREGDRLVGDVDLPDGVSGELLFGSARVALSSGAQEIDVS
jgi:alpha-L-rhamnosidase